VPPKFNFFLQWANLISPWLKIKKKLLRLPKIEGSILKYRVGPPLWPTYISERRTKFANAYWIKVRCYREHNENLRHMLGTWWEHIGNTKNPKKITSPSLPFSPKRQKHGSLGWMLAHLIGCQEIRFLFWLGCVEISMGVFGWFSKFVEPQVWFWAGFFKFLGLYLVMVFFKRNPIPIWLWNWRMDWWGAPDCGHKPLEKCFDLGGSGCKMHRECNKASQTRLPCQ